MGRNTYNSWWDHPPGALTNLEEGIRAIVANDIPEDFNSRVQGTHEPPQSPAKKVDMFSCRQIPRPLVIDHILGQNDLMHGALSPGSEGPNLPMNDSLDCAENLGDQFKYMKWRILNAYQVASIPNLFQNTQSCFEALGENFLITNEGLRRAIEEVHNTDIGDNDLDTIVLGALAKRGGRVFRDPAGRVPVYPEDMYPIIGDEQEWCDASYWKDLYSQGDFWAKLSQ